jgi:peroxiredoxin Q/BCP
MPHQFMGFGALALALTLLGMSSCRSAAANGLLPQGTAVPDLSGTDQDGKLHQLTEARGHPMVVYFYPKDATPGCTKEACAFRDVWQKYQEAGVRLFGVSRDPQTSHAQFALEHRLPFPLIADTEATWAKAFGVATTLGRFARVTFVIAPDGKVARVYPNVDPGLHAGEVLEDIRQLGYR